MSGSADGLKMARFPSRQIARRGGKAAAIFASVAICIAAAALLPKKAAAQEAKPTLRVDEDCSAFAVARDNSIVYSVPHDRHIKKIHFERDDIWVVEPDGRKKRIVDGDKFFPPTPPTGFQVNSLAWSPDGKRIVVNMTVIPATDDPDAPVGGIRSIALLDGDGNEIKAGAEGKRFIENGIRGTWLADGQTVAYLSQGPPYRITRVQTVTGRSKVLFEGMAFDDVAWDAKDDAAFVVGHNLTAFGKLGLMELNLQNETVREISRIEEYEGELTVSSDARRVGFFLDGDTIEVRELAEPLKPIRTKAGMGRFEFGKDGRRVMLKRGPDEKSADLVWVGVYDGTFTPILHDLEFHNFQIAPDGNSIAVTMVGKRVLLVYPLQ